MYMITLWLAGVEAGVEVGEFRLPAVVNAFTVRLDLFFRFIGSTVNSDCDSIGDAVHQLLALDPSQSYH